jgi:hypothetical protein
MPWPSKMLVATTTPSASFPLLPGPSSTHMALVTQKELDRRMGPAEGLVHHQLRGRHGALVYPHGPGNGQARTRRDATPVHATLF